VALFGAALACGRPSTPLAVPSPAVLGTTWSYEVVAAKRAEALAVEAIFPRGTPSSFSVGEGAEPFVNDVVVVEGARRTAVHGHDGRWNIPACQAGCRVGYQFALRKAGAASGDRSLAEAIGDVVEAPPSSWLLRPVDAPVGSTFRFHVTSAPGEAFATGVFPVAGAADTYEGQTVEPFDLPYAAFGPLRRVSLEGGHVEVALLPGAFREPALITPWVERSARAVEGYYGRPPVPRIMVLVRPVEGDSIGFGSTMGSSGAAIDMAVGRDIDEHALRDDWVLVHEMIHTAFPDVTREHHWLEEGLATYVESLARARAGLVSVDRVWADWIKGMPHGQPEAGDQGLDRTHTWGRTYWGGALFCLVADIEIRARTNDQRSLDDALRAILAEGGSIAVSWPIERVLDVGDRATGVAVLRELYTRMAPRAERVDLAALWKRLGVAKRAEMVVYDEGAPLASIRRSLVRPAMVGAQR
jgi:hypothetical protein